MRQRTRQDDIGLNSSADINAEPNDSQPCSGSTSKQIRRSTRRPGQVSATEQVEVDMPDRLATRFVAVVHHTEAVF